MQLGCWKSLKFIKSLWVVLTVSHHCNAYIAYVAFMRSSKLSWPTKSKNVERRKIYFLPFLEFKERKGIWLFSSILPFTCLLLTNYLVGNIFYLLFIESHVTLSLLDVFTIAKQWNHVSHHHENSWLNKTRKKVFYLFSLTFWEQVFVCKFTIHKRHLQIYHLHLCNVMNNNYNCRNLFSLRHEF